MHCFRQRTYSVSRCKECEKDGRSGSRLKEEEQKRIVELYESGCEVKQICNDVGRSREAVIYLLKGLGFTDRGVAIEHRAHYLWDNEERPGWRVKFNEIDEVKRQYYFKRARIEKESEWRQSYFLLMGKYPEGEDLANSSDDALKKEVKELREENRHLKELFKKYWEEELND